MLGTFLKEQDLRPSCYSPFHVDHHALPTAWTSHVFRQTRQHRFSNPNYLAAWENNSTRRYGQKSYLVVYLSGPLKVRSQQSAGLSDYSLTLV
jgi:hypothetical protein